MSKSRTSGNVKLGTAKSAIRFAHPFFTVQDPTERRAFHGAKRMTNHIKVHLKKTPPVKGDSIMHLGEIIGDDSAKAIEDEKSIMFHSIGDTGHENGLAQE